MRLVKEDQRGSIQFQGRVGSLVKTFSPGFHTWLLECAGSPYRSCLLLVFVVVDFALRFIGETVHTPGINPLSVVVFTNFASLAIALTVTFALEQYALAKIFSWQLLWRFCFIAFLFTVSSVCTKTAFELGSSGQMVETVGYVYMPVAALASLFVLHRKYGNLEWLALGISTLGVATFIQVKIRGTNSAVKDSHDIALVMVSASVSALASVLAERIYKNRSTGIGQVSTFSADEHFYVYKVHLDFACLMFSAALWILSSCSLVDFAVVWSGPWFGAWQWKDGWVMLITVIQGWLAGMTTKEFSTVTR
jgi:hypothetical protein